MQVLSSRKSAKHYSGNGRVAGKSECFFEGDECEGQEVGEHVETEECCWEVDGEEAPEEVWEGVVVMGYEGVGSCDGVVICFVEFADEVGAGRMEYHAVDIVLQDLSQYKRSRNIFKNRPRHWQRCCNLQCASHVKDLGEEQINTCLDSNS